VLPLSEPGMLRGRLFPPNRASPHPASLTIQSDGSLLLESGDARQTLPPGSLRWSSRIGATPRCARLEDGAVFETDDNDQVDMLERALGRRGVGLLHRLENIGAPLLVLVTLAVLAFFIGLRWTVPWLGDAASRVVPHAIEARIGAAALDNLDRVALRPSALPADKQHAILAVFDELAGQADTPAGSLKLAFRRGEGFLGPNALALPGGQIIVTDELVELAQTPDAVAGVLAHEIAHVEHRHGLRRLGRIAGLSAVVMLMTGDVSSMTHDFGVLATGLLDLDYSRSFEVEADARATVLMRATHRNPETLAALLEKLAHEGPGAGPNWLSSHPPTEERARLIRGER
jgi:Zn-dependent protease with chaperone function